MLLPQILRSRAQIALPLLKRSIRLQTQTAAVSSHLRCFATVPEELKAGEASNTTNTSAPSPPLVEEASYPILPPPPPPSLTEGAAESSPASTAQVEAQAETPGVPIQKSWIRRVGTMTLDPNTIGYTALKITRSGEEISYRNITLERLLEVCRDPSIMPSQLIIKKVTMNLGTRGGLKEIIHNIQYPHIAEERKWVAENSDPKSTVSPIMAMLGVTDVESDTSRYVVTNQHVSGLGIGIEKPDAEMLARPVMSFFPRRIEENMKALKKAGRASHVLVEVRDGLIAPYPRITALGVISNQIKSLINALDRNQVVGPQGMRPIWSGRLYRSMLTQMNRSSEYADSILGTPIEESVSITGPDGDSKTMSHDEVLLLYLEESAESLRKLQRFLASTYTGEGKENMRDNTQESDYFPFTESALLERRISNNLEALKAVAPRLDSSVFLDTFLGGRKVPMDNAAEVIFRQIRTAVGGIEKLVKPIAKREKARLREKAKLISKRESLPRVRFVDTSPPSLDVGKPPIRHIHSTYFLPLAPGGSRGYSTISFRGLAADKVGGKGRKNAFGKPVYGDPPAQRGPIKVKEGSIRHKMQLMEEKRLESLKGLGYTLMASNQLGGSSGALADVIVDKEGDGGVSTWEGTGEIGGLNDESGLTPLKKGDLCELRMGSGPEIAIFLRPSPNGQPTADFLLETGERAMHNAARVVFAIPSFVSEEKTSEIIAAVDHMRDNSDLPPERHGELVLPRSIMTDINKRMRGFSKKAKMIYAKEKGKFLTLYDRMALPDADSELTLFEAAEEIFGEKYGNEELYTTHLALMEDGVRYLTDKGAHRATSTFRLRGKKEVEMIEFVTEQVRLDTGAVPERHIKGAKPKNLKQEVSLLESFAKKARVLIDTSRKNAAKDLGGTKTVKRMPVKEIVWDDNDKKFIDYVKAGVLQYGSQSVPMDGLVPVILRAVDRYEGDLDNITAYQFCTDIGAWNKWEDLSLRQKNIAFPGMGVSKQADKDQEQFDVVNGPKGMENLNLVDSLKHIRKDWGNMEVFAIDDITAHEIDDGISLERVDENVNWVHVHIANPTAWLPPNHWLSDLAFRRKQSLYLPNQVLPMLPTALTERVGLASNRGVMTMSAKVNMDGEILEYNLQPGYVKNVKRFTYDAVSEALGYGKPERTLFRVGSFPEIRRPAPEKLNKSQIADLTTLKKIALAFRKIRVKNDLINVVTPRVDVSVHTGLTPFVHPDSNTPHLYRGHPAMRLSIEVSGSAEAGSQFLVSEMMQLANSVTARFCGKHNIAAPFRVMEYDHERSDLLDSYKNMILPARDELGSVPPELGIHYMMLIGKTRISASPSPHRLMGLDDGYIRASSPLRRYSDMITHWQIEAFLLGKEPRTHKQITPFALELERGERLTAFTMKESNRFWASVAIKRMMELKDPSMPKQLTFMVMEKVQHPSMSTGLVWELGMAGKVAFESMAQFMAIRAGDMLAVEPLAAMPGEKMVWFKCKGIIKKRSLNDVFL